MDKELRPELLRGVYEGVSAERILRGEVQRYFVLILLYLGDGHQLRKISYVRNLYEIYGRLRHIAESVQKLVYDLVLVVV